MNFLRRLTSLFGGKPGASGSRQLPVYVLSRRCNEPIAGQVDLFNELSQAEEGDYAYYTRKVLHTSGERRCFDQVEVELWFDSNKKLAHHEVKGGRWLDASEYETELARFLAPPEPEPEHEAEATATTTGKDSDHAQTDDGGQLEDEQDRGGSSQPGPGDSR